MKKIILMAAVCLLAVNLFGYYCANESNCAFSPNLCALGKWASNGAESVDDYRIALSIRDATNNGAQYLLLAYSDLNRYMSDMENETTLSAGILGEVIVNLEVAGGYYEELLQLVQKREYSTPFIEKLKRFDYTTFEKANRVHPYVFITVKRYLADGDVKGWLKFHKNQISDILDCLYSLVDDPTVEGTWKLNQQYSELIAAGQYTSMIFTAVKNN